MRFKMHRIVEPEILNTISPGDPRSFRVRRDLARINFWMRNRQIMSATLKDQFGGTTPKQIAEIGAGDGTFLLQVAGKSNWKNVHAILLDQQNVVTRETLMQFSKLNWRAEPLETDVFDWQKNDIADDIIANLFLHHFYNGRLLE